MWVQKGGPPDQPAAHFQYDLGRVRIVPLEFFVKASATLYSLTKASKLNLLESYDYLRWLFTELPKGHRSLEELMLWSIDGGATNLNR